MVLDLCNQVDDWSCKNCFVREYCRSEYVLVVRMGEAPCEIGERVQYAGSKSVLECFEA